MGMVKMEHVNIYGPERDPQATLEVLARAACFQPDDVAESINAATGQAENKYTPLLNQTLGLIKDLGQDNTLLAYDGRMFEYDEVRQTVEKLAAQVAERNRMETEINAKLATY